MRRTCWIPWPLLITPIFKEHAQYLGGTILEIAGEKAGIIKAGRPLLTSAFPKPELRPFLKNGAKT